MKSLKMVSAHQLLLALLLMLFCYELQACHNDHGGAYEEGEGDEHGGDGDYDEEDFSKRRKRNIIDDAVKTRGLRAYFTSCIEMQLPDSPYDWQSNVDFSILDSMWYLNTHQTYCGAAGGGETQECWQEEVTNYIKGNTEVLRAVQTCIAHFVEDTGSVPPTNRYRRRREKRNSPTSFRSYTFTSTEVPSLSFGAEELPSYTTCLDTTISFKRIRAPLNFRNLSLFIDGNTVDGCNSRRFSKRKMDPTWPYRFVTLTRPDSMLRAELEECAKQIYPPDAYWSSWGGWGTCSQTCGEGSQTRRRKCRSGVDSGEQSQTCQGVAIETKFCYIAQCLVYSWGSWNVFNKCSRSCGGGTQQRTRSCRLNNRFNVNLDRCHHLNGISRERKICNSRASCVAGPQFNTWTPWTRFSSCQISAAGPDGCRRGYQDRSRICVLGNRQVSPTNCDGSNHQDRRICFIECSGSSLTSLTSTNFTFGFQSTAG